MNSRIGVMLAVLLYGVSIAGAVDFELRLGHGAAVDNPRHIIAREFAEAVKERTGGRVTIDVHHSESLGSDSQMAEALMLGKLDMSINSQGAIATYVEELNVVGLPFLFSNPEQAFLVLDGHIGRKIARPLERRNMKILAFWDNGFRQITNNRHSINRSEDLRDMRIRTPDDRLTTAIFRALGADPAPLAFGKLHEALKDDVFEGQENPLTNIYYSKLYEVQKYLSITNHKYECCPLVISMRTWRLLPEDIQATIEELAREFAVKHREVNRKLNRSLLDRMVESGMVVNQADAGEMRARCESVYKDFEKTFGKTLVDEVMKMANQQ